MRTKVVFKYIIFIVLLKSFSGCEFKKEDFQESKEEVTVQEEKIENDSLLVVIEGNTREEISYKNERKNGSYKRYFYGKLTCIGYYQDDKKVGEWLYYNDEILFLQEIDIVKNEITLVTEGSNYEFTPKYSSTCILYHKNGNTKSKGKVLYDESPLEETSIEIEDWKYYDNQGNLIRQEFYTPKTKE